MKIVGIHNISSSNSDEFISMVSSTINKLQDDDQEVEVQYCINVSEFISGIIVYSALIIGRK